jgi:hypothetical protein
MARVLIEVLLFFCGPFVLYAAVMWARGVNPLQASAWPLGRLASLTLAGAGVVIWALVFIGIGQTEKRGAYVPAQYRDGVLIPGRIE